MNAITLAKLNQNDLDLLEQTYSKPSSTFDQFDFDSVSDLIDILIDS